MTEPRRRLVCRAHGCRESVLLASHVFCPRCWDRLRAGGLARALWEAWGTEDGPEAIQWCLRFLRGDED